jgi:hypothetical protein
MKTEVASFFETLVTTYKTVWTYNLEDSTKMFTSFKAPNFIKYFALIKYYK